MKQNSQTKHQKLENEEKNIFRIGYRWIAKKPVETVYRGKSLRKITETNIKYIFFNM